MKPVSLDSIVDNLEMMGDGVIGYISTKTGHTVIVTDEMEMMLDSDDPPEWFKEVIPEIRLALDSEEYIPLPDSFEIHEYAIMERFCLGVQDEKLRSKLLAAIRGRGAFRRFKGVIYHGDIEQNWYDYRDNALAQIAKDFLDAHKIPYIDDSTGIE